MSLHLRYFCTLPTPERISGPALTPVPAMG
jgi:hypothetical protein